MLNAIWTCFAVAGVASGQPPIGEPVPKPTPVPATATSILTEPTPAAGQPVVVVDEEVSDRRLLGSFDFLMGTFSGVRYQTRPLFLDGRWSAEIFGGTAIVILPSAGVGLRRHVYRSGNSSDVICVSPGFGAYVMFWP